jgi:hypothetical protein
LLKALYGTLKAALMFWEKLTSKLIDWGFTINPYDTCVANKLVNGKYLTVTWHIDDLKVSHVSVDVVDWFISKMDDEFGREAPLVVSRGRAHDLGMTLDFNVPGEVVVSMEEYVKSVLHNLPEKLRGKAVTPAANHLFTTNPNPVTLDAGEASTFV